MLDNITKRRIDDCRDILVGKLPDPKSQIEQITIALIYKFMDDMDKEAIELGGKAKFFSDYTIPDPNDPKKEIVIPFEKYSWDNLFDTKVSATEMLKLYSEAIEGMVKNPNIPELFSNIFKNAYLPYRDPETLKMFLKTISEFEYTHSEKLGDAFEYLLSVMGSQGDAGQFRTPRHIIDFLVAAVDPNKNDTILDPACGTAGFLISAFKYITNNGNDYRRDAIHGVSTGKNLTPDEQKRLIKNFVGYDISPDMVRLSLVNLYLHGFSDPHIHEYDSLSSEDRWNETFDVVLANPPFMSPKGGIRPHKKFTITSNRSEVLFVDYIAEHLNPKGRAGIIVPEGIIFQSGTAYKALRKMLIDKYLYAVVSLPAGVFNPYSGVKTSILLMDADLAKKTKDVLFVKIDNDGYGLGAQRNAVKGGQLEEAISTLKTFRENCIEGKPFENNTLAQAVSKTEIGKSGDYNLSGESYKLQTEINSDFELIDFEDAIDKVIYSNKLKSSDYTDSGKFPIIDQSDKFIAGFWDNEKDVFKITKPVTIFGDHTRCFKYVDFDFVLGADGVKILQPNYKFNSKFFYYLIKDIDIKNLGYSRHYKELKNKKIPLPPLSVQEDIVAEIESYQKIIDGAKMVVDNYKPRIEIDKDWEMVELGKVCDVTSGGTPDRGNEDYWNGNIPYIKTGQIFFNRINNADEFITDAGLKNSSTRLIEPGTILMAMYGQGVTRGRVAILEIEAAINQAVAAIKVNEKLIISEFLYFQLVGLYDYLRKISDARGGNQSNLNAKLIKDLKIAVPQIEIQQLIVSQIEKEQTLVNANKELITIYELKIKDRIGKVWGN